MIACRDIAREHDLAMQRPSAAESFRGTLWPLSNSIFRSRVVELSARCSLSREARRRCFFAWVQWQRRILVRWEFHAQNFLGFVQLALPPRSLQAILRWVLGRLP